MKALIYARLACYDEKRLEAQVQQAEQYCDKNNIKVLDTLIASTYTAKSYKSQAYTELLLFVKKHIQKDLTLVIRDYTRISRDISSALDFELFCDRNGIKIISLANLDDEKPALGFFVKKILLIAPNYS